MNWYAVAFVSSVIVTVVSVTSATTSVPLYTTYPSAFSAAFQVIVTDVSSDAVDLRPNAEGTVYFTVASFDAAAL